MEVDGEYYLIPSRERTNNELSSFKKISKAAIENNSEELPNYRYILKDLEKRSGYDITIGRAISKREFDEVNYPPLRPMAMPIGLEEGASGRNLLFSCLRGVKFT